MLASIAVKLVNHALDGESWARKRLQSHTGKIARVRIFPFADFTFTIQVDGKILTLADNGNDNVVITLTQGTLLRILASDETAVNYLSISGDESFAKELITIGKYLQWDLEHDLSGFVGDILAHRITHGGDQLLHWHKESMHNFAEALAEYWTEEQPLLASKILINEFNSDVTALQRDIEQLEHRIQNLISQEN